MARGLTKKQKGFVKDYLETGNGTQSALKHYDTEDYNTAHVIASENLQKPTVIAYLESKADRAAERVVELSEQEDMLPVALGASKDILDRAGYKPIDRTINASLNIDANSTDRTRELGTRLVRLFGRRG